MSKSKRTRPRIPSESSPGSAGNSGSQSLVLPVLFPSLILALLFSRWLIAAESAPEGESLWLTSLTLISAAGWSWWNSSDRSLRLRIDRFDVLVWLLAAAYVVAAVHVLTSGGNLRSAANLIWEWLAIAVLCSLLRRTLRAYVRNSFLTAFVALSVALAGFGFWQQLVWYPQMRASYQADRARLDQFESGAAVPEHGERERLLAQFNVQGVPLAGPSRELFERRLADSSEPMGFFALANSFAGLLAVTSVLLSGFLLLHVWPDADDATSASGELKSGSGLKSRDELKSADASSAGFGGETQSGGGRDRRSVVAITTLAACLVLVLWCLVLTKSRTAWVGTFAGLGALAAFCMLGRRSPGAARRIFIAGVVVVLVSGAAGAIGALTGAIDAKVISEAPKSLQYRFEYWTASLQLIADHPLFGVGPGSFQSSYLAYKLPASSEEIADPHQMFLDVAANAGLPALLLLLGILSLVVAAINRLLRGSQIEGRSSLTEYAGLTGRELDQVRSSSGQIAWLSISMTTLIVFGAGWLIDASASWQVLSVGTAAVGISILLPRLVPQFRDLQACDRPVLLLIVAAALIALIVHLQGAGGVGMPAILSTLLAICCLLVPAPIDDDESFESGSARHGAPRTTGATSTGGITPAAGATRYRVWQLLAAISAASAIGCVVFSMVPSMSARANIRATDFQINSVPLAQSRRNYQIAAEIDPLSATAWLRVAELEFNQWYATGTPEHLQRGLQAIDEAIRRESTSPSLKAIPGLRCLNAPAALQTEEVQQIAQERLESALAGYPNNAVWHAELAEIQARRGLTEPSRQTARRALELDELNRAAGHADKYLPDGLKQRTEALAASHAE